jgi:hypothetical protein
MLTNYQQMLITDLTGPNSYGTPLVAWKGQTEFFRAVAAPPQPGALPPDLAGTFVDTVYILLRTARTVRVYRGFETLGLKAPFGVDHPSFIQGLLSHRNPGKPDGLWWTPARPSMAIDNMRMSDMHRAEHRDGAAIKLEWNRIDFYLEGDLPAGVLVYVGRAAPQQESVAYGGKAYGGGAFQFRLTAPPQQILKFLKQYAAS